MSSWKRIVLFGDSITQYSLEPQGWASYIAQLVQRKCDIFNRGFSGYTTDYAVKILKMSIDKDLLQDIAVVTVFFGANDSSLLEYNSRQHVPLSKYENNLYEIIKHFQNLGVTSDNIILISPPSVCEKAWLERMIMKEKGNTCDRSNIVTEKYANACKKVAVACKCRHVDLWSEIMAKEDWSTYLSDGLHLSDKGNHLLAHCLEPHILALTEHLPMILPPWDQFDL